MVTHYCHEDEESLHEPCLVQMFKQYISLVNELPKIYESFYFRPSKTAYKFENAPIGIHKLNSIVPFLTKLHHQDQENTIERMNSDLTSIQSWCLTSWSPIPEKQK